MKITVLFVATNMAQLSELGQMLDNPESLSLLSLVEPYQNILNMLDGNATAATLHHHVMPNDQYYHAVGVMDINGITYVAHDRQTISSLMGEVSMATEFEEVQNKAKQYDRIIVPVRTPKHKSTE